MCACTRECVRVCERLYEKILTFPSLGLQKAKVTVSDEIPACVRCPDHVINDTQRAQDIICGSISVSSTSMKKKITFIAVDAVCIALRSQHKSLSTKAGECLLTSVTEQHGKQS